MSMLQIPEELIPGTRTFEKINAEMNSQLTKDMQNAANLFAHPAASVAAASALGIGFASYSFGIWMGVVAGATEATQRLFAPVVGDIAGDVDSFADRKEAPAKRAEVTAKALIKDSKWAVKAVEKASPPAKNIAEEESEAVAEAMLETGFAAEPALETVSSAEEATNELMPEDFRQPKALEQPETPDDLKAISGIGPKLEKVLNGLGVWTYAQVVAWTPEEVAWIDDTLGFKGRIGRDNWIGQAARLAKGETTK